MRVFCTAAVIASVAGPAYGQAQPPVTRYGEQDKEKTTQQKSDEKAAAEAYKRSLGNIPEQKASDPWGTVRSDSAPKPAKDKPAKDKAAKDPVAKDAAAKRTRAGGTAN